MELFTIHKAHSGVANKAFRLRKTNHKLRFKEVLHMIVLLIRTIIIYIFLLLTMRLMGKRQLGELEISELVSTLLLSDIASLPITNQEIPLTYAIVPILAITAFEVSSSLLLTKVPRLKYILSTRPSVVIQKGKINKSELLKNRISVDELISELRQKSITDISQVDYAIIEQNGKMTVIPKAKADFVLTRAETYVVPQEVRHCYFFNPFSVEILHKVMNKITDSYYASSREMFLFFYYPPTNISPIL